MSPVASNAATPADTKRRHRRICPPSPGSRSYPNVNRGQSPGGLSGDRSHLDHREDVAGRVLEPGDERAALPVDALGVDEVVMLELHASRGQFVHRSLDIG